MPDAVTARTDAAFDSLISTLSDPGDTLPAKAVKQVRQHWEAFFPRLLEEMRAAIDVVRDGEDPGDIVFWGLALIAERDVGEATEAFPVLVQILSLTSEQIEWLIGDMLHEFLPQTLANVAVDQVELLEGMFGDPELEVSARTVIATTLVHLVADDRLPREQAVQLFRGHLQRVLEQHQAGTYSDDEYFPTVLVNHLTDLLPHEAEDELFAAFAAHLVEELMIDERDVRRRIDEGQFGLNKEMKRYRGRQVNDCLAILKHWGNFDKPSRPPYQKSDPLTEVTPGIAAETFQRREAKVGRNEPCPCGSGRKYKKCCGRA